MDKKSILLINRIIRRYNLDFELDLDENNIDPEILTAVINNLYEKSDMKVISKFIKSIYNRFINEIKRNNFDTIEIFNHFFFPLLGKINQRQDNSIIALLKDIVDSILSYHQNSFILLLIFEDLLDLFNVEERKRIVDTYLLEELIITLNQSIQSEYFPDTYGDFKCYLNRL